MKHNHRKFKDHTIASGAVIALAVTLQCMPALGAGSVVTLHTYDFDEFTMQVLPTAFTHAGASSSFQGTTSGYVYNVNEATVDPDFTATDISWHGDFDTWSRTGNQGPTNVWGEPFGRCTAAWGESDYISIETQFAASSPGGTLQDFTFSHSSDGFTANTMTVDIEVWINGLKQPSQPSWMNNDTGLDLLTPSSWVTDTFDLSSVSFSGGDLVDVRIYTNGGMDNAAGGSTTIDGRDSLGIDGVQLTAMVVPEPSSAILVFVAGLAVILRRRRR